MTDEAGLAEALAEDVDGHFETLVTMYGDRLYGFAVRLTRSTQDAEEVLQDTFMRSYRALHGYSPARRRELRLRPWLYQIALNVVRNRVRRHHTVQVDLEAAPPARLIGPVAEWPEHVALASERQQELARAVGALPPRYAEAVVLRHVQGLSYVETAAVLGQPVGTTKSDVHRGLRMLREMLAPELLLEAAGSH
jgi:RNA polymerase sigma-70 factor (ECF subfamily)